MSAPQSSTDNLEHRAQEQRRRLERTARELVSKVEDTVREFNPTHVLRKHFATAALLASGLAVVSGYALAVLFTRR